MSRRTDHRLTIRFTGEEYAELKAKAGGTPLASYARRQLLDETTAKRKSPKNAPIKDHVALAQVLALLGASDLVSTFRDAMRGARDGVVPRSQETDVLLTQIARTLAEIKRLLVRALGIAER